jgi:hypothetical protein
MRRSHLSSIVVSVVTASLALATTPALTGCATSPADDAALASDESEVRPVEEAPPSQTLPARTPPESQSGTVTGDDDAGHDGAADAGADGNGGTVDGGTDAAGAAQSVVIKLVPTRNDWLVAGQPAPFLVQLDAKNCNLFGNACDANVQVALSIDAPVASPASSPSCSRLQSGTGVRQCAEGSAVTKSATLKPGDHVKVRFHAEAVDDPGANPSCDIDKTWTFTGTGFTLDGETFPATSYWQCIGGGSGQNLDVLLGYKLAL